MGSAHQAVLEAIPRQRECSHPKQKGGCRIPATALLFVSVKLDGLSRQGHPEDYPAYSLSLFLAEVDLDLEVVDLRVVFFLVVAALVVFFVPEDFDAAAVLVVFLALVVLRLPPFVFFSGGFGVNPLHCLLQGNGVNLGGFRAQRR